MLHVISLRRRNKVKTSCVLELYKLLWRKGGLEVGEEGDYILCGRNHLSKEIMEVGDGQASSESTQ